MNVDETFLRRAIRLAMSARGAVEPNPMVGCVLARGETIIGEGFHARFGGAHAEPEALQDARNRGHDPRGATAYVTLEPCCHTNKKTPPCAPRLIEAGIARVVVGCLDPNPQVNGSGISMLRAAGIRVDRAPAALEAESRQLIAPFIALTVHHRPYVTLKWAQTADGFVAGPRGERLKITGGESDKVVHALRGRCDAIAVGTNTVLADDPMLTQRGVDAGPRVPLRVILSNSLKFPLESRLVRSAREVPVIVYCSQHTAGRASEHVAALERAGVQVRALPTRDENRFSLADVLHDLAARQVAHLLIEPGPTLARYLLSRGQADRVWVFRSPELLRLEPELSISRAPSVSYPAVATARIGRDELTEYLNPQSDVFFAAGRSADLAMSVGDEST